MDRLAGTVVHHQDAWHVGTFDPADKGQFVPSYGGTGLSVSQDPAAWQQIARLGGMPWWELARSDGRPGRFLNTYAFGPDGRDELYQWGRQLGLVADR